MAARVRHNWPSDARIIEIAGECERIADIAKRIGVPLNTLDSRLGTRDIREDVHAAMQKGLVDPESPQSELARVRQSRDEALRELRKQRKLATFEARAIEELRSALGSVKPRYSSKAIPKRKPGKGHEFVLLWSDLHAGEVVSEVETNGMNAYDWATMLERHDRLKEAVFSFADHRPYPVERLHIFALGDMLGGDIHDELAETNELGVAEATVQAAVDLAPWLGSFVERFRDVRVSGIVGNHGRRHRKPRAKQAFENADWLAYHGLRAALSKEDRITFDIPKAGQHPVELCGQRALLWHGDGVRSTMPGVPWGGVLRRANALQAQYTQAGAPIDLFCCGHFHTANAVAGPADSWLCMNGSVKGPDEYTLKAFGGGQRARQLLLTLHPDRGLTDVSVIDL